MPKSSNQNMPLHWHNWIIVSTAKVISWFPWVAPKIQYLLSLNKALNLCSLDNSPFLTSMFHLLSRIPSSYSSPKVWQISLNRAARTPLCISSTPLGRVITQSVRLRIALSKSCIREGERLSNSAKRIHPILRRGRKWVLAEGFSIKAGSKATDKSTESTVRTAERYCRLKTYCRGYCFRTGSWDLVLSCLERGRGRLFSSSCLQKGN